MKSKGKLYRITFITGLILILMIAIAYRYIPFSKIIRVAGSRELSFNDSVKTGSEPPGSIAFDFEVPLGKEVPNGFLSGNAHSGKYAAKAFGKNAFTPAMEKMAGELGIERLRYISVSAWVFVKPGPDPVTAALVLAASNNVGVNISWKGIGLRDPLVPRGKWFKMSGQFDLSDVKFSKDTRLQMYFWNNSNTDILIDDYYMVYGGPRPRRGDTTYVDLTKGPYQEKFNYPPFPVRCLRMAEIAGIQGPYLIESADKKQGIILPSDPMISGLFLSGNAGRDVLFVFRPDGKSSVFSYFTESNSFNRSQVELPVELSFTRGKHYLLKGKFVAGETEQLLYMGEKSCSLLKFTNKGSAGKEGNMVGMELMWQSENLENLPFDNDSPLLSSDFDGDGQNEILFSGSRGDWKLYRFRPGKPYGSWAVIAEGNEEIVDWQTGKGPLRLTEGHFIPGRAQAQVLAVTESTKDRKCSYTLRIYNPSQKRFVPFFTGRSGPQGLVVGIDTLKPSDVFFCGNFGISGTPMVMRYNRDWRYDFKEISFVDSTFHILNNIDFGGYETDQNPKYYEVLKLIPGRFTGTQCSFLVIGRNCKDKDFNGKDCSEYMEMPELPDFISVYSFVNR